MTSSALSALTEPCQSILTVAQWGRDCYQSLHMWETSALGLDSRGAHPRSCSYYMLQPGVESIAVVLEAATGGAGRVTPLTLQQREPRLGVLGVYGNPACYQETQSPYVRREPRFPSHPQPFVKDDKCLLFHMKQPAALCRRNQPKGCWKRTQGGKVL